MANNKIQVKRTSTSGRTPNTTNSGNAQYIGAGELALNMADGILYSSNGSAVIEVGANNTSARVTGTLTVNAISANGGVGTSGQVLKSNGSSTYWATDEADVGAANQILYRNSSNALTSSSGLQYDGTSIKVNGNLESVYQNGDEGGEIFLSKPSAANTSLAGTGVTIDVYQNRIRFFENGGTNRGAYIDITAASTGIGTNLLAGGGGGGSVDVNAQYVWTNLHTFSANVSISANAIGLTTNTSAIYFAGTGDVNWKMGRNTGAFTKWKYTNNSVDIAIANSNLEGFTIGNAINPGNSFFETGYLGTFIASNVTIGNSTVNASINSTAFSGTSNNASSLGGTAAANFVQNTDSRTLSGNLVISGTYFNPSANTILLGNSTQRWVLSATSGDFSSTVNAVTSVNSALLTVGASFIANTTGVYHTGTINAASVTTTGITVNTSGVYPTSNTSGQGLGTATQRFDAFLDVVDVSGAINTNAGANAIVLSNNTSQFIVFAGGGSAAPTNTTRSPGTKIVIWPSVGASSVDYGIGTDNYVQWYSVGQTIASHLWYANTTNFMTANISGLYHSGTVNAASHTVGTSFTANSTVVNAVSYYAGTLLVANTTVVNATHLSGKTEGNLNVNNALTANNADYVKANNGITSNSFGVFVNGGPTTTVNTTGVHVNTTLSLQTLTTTGNVTIGGNLTVSGNVTVIGANNLSIVDNFIYLNSNNTTQNIDLGFAGNYNDGTYKHAGFFRDASDGYWKPFDGYTPEPDAAVDIDTSNSSFNIAGMWFGNTRIGNTTVYATINSTVYSGSANNTTYVNGKTEGNLNVNNATQLATARTIGDVSFNGTANILPARISYYDTRSTNYSPFAYPGLTYHLKTNTTDGLSDGGTYHGVLGLAQWTDISGGNDHQLAFTDNNNMWIRQSSNSSTWSSWTQIVTTASGTALTANNSTYFGGYTWAAPGLLGSSTANGASFTYANVTGQVNTATLYVTTSANIGTAVIANSVGLTTTGFANVSGTGFFGNTVQLRGYTGGTVGSLISSHTKTLQIGGAYNQSYNSGDAALLHIADYSNDTGDNVYPIYVEDENNIVDFYLWAGNNNLSSSKRAYFGGNVGIGNTAPTDKLSVNGTTNLGGNTTISGFINATTTAQFGGNLTLASTSAIIANNTAGTAGQVLHSNGTAVYWAADDNSGGTVTSISIGTGLSSTQSPLTTSGTISLATAGAGAASYTSGISAITVDAYGRVTSVSGSAGYVTSSGVTSISPGTGMSSGVGNPAITGTGTLSVNTTYLSTLYLGISATAADSSLLGGVGPGSYARLDQSEVFSNISGIRIYSLGVGIGASGTQGEIVATNDITAFYSDARLKDRVEIIGDALKKVKKISGVTYENSELARSFGFNKKNRMVGVLAHEIEAVLPEAVTLAPFDMGEPDEDGNPTSISGENYKTVKYDKLVSLLIEAIKELSSEVDELRTEIRDLKK